MPFLFFIVMNNDPDSPFYVNGKPEVFVREILFTKDSNGVFKRIIITIGVPEKRYFPGDGREPVFCTPLIIEGMNDYIYRDYTPILNITPTLSLQTALTFVDRLLSDYQKEGNPLFFSQNGAEEPDESGDYTWVSQADILGALDGKEGGEAAR